MGNFYWSFLSALDIRDENCLTSCSVSLTAMHCLFPTGCFVEALLSGGQQPMEEMCTTAVTMTLSLLPSLPNQHVTKHSPKRG